MCGPNGASCSAEGPILPIAQLTTWRALDRKRRPSLAEIDESLQCDAHGRIVSIIRYERDDERYDERDDERRALGTQ